MSEKKVVRRSVAIGLGMISILLIAGLGAAIAYYTMTIKNKDSTYNDYVFTHSHTDDEYNVSQNNYNNYVADHHQSDEAYASLQANYSQLMKDYQGAPTLLYDSGWLDLTGQTGQHYTVVHNLNLTGADIIVDARERNLGWNKTYGGPGYEWAYSLVQTSDGGYALAGTTSSFGAGGYDFWLVRTDPGGNVLWNQTYGGAGDDGAYSIVQTGDGGFALGGFTHPSGAVLSDFWLVRTDASGNMLWNRTYGETHDEVARSMIQTRDGGYALAGDTFSTITGFSDAWLVKTDANGNVQWNGTYGGANDDGAYSVVQTSDDGYALAGWTKSFGFGNGLSDAWLVKTDANGSMQWNQTYGGAGIDWTRALIQTRDGGYALIGVTSSFGAGDWDFWLIKTNPYGIAEWNKTYGGGGTDDAWSIVQTSDGGYALGGSTGSNAWLVKTDATGDALWNRTFGGTYSAAAYCMVQTSDGGYALAGSTSSFGAGNEDFWLVKTDAEFGLAWVDSTADSITLWRGVTSTYWSFVRLRIWQIHNS